MLDLRAVTKSVLRQVETLSGKPVEFVADDELPVMVTMQIARQGAPCHLLRNRSGGGPLDYLVVHQAGFVLRLFANEPSQRFDLVAKPKASLAAEAMMAAGRELNDDDWSLLPGFAAAVSRWALMTLRSTPVGMRVDAWIATGMPELAEMQRKTSIDALFAPGDAPSACDNCDSSRAMSPRCAGSSSSKSARRSNSSRGPYWSAW